MLQRRLFVLALAIATLEPGLIATSTQGRGAAQKHIVYSTSAFTGIISPHYSGMDIRQLYKALVDSRPKRGEFELAADFEARVAAWNARSLVGTIQRQSELAFVFPIPESSEFKQSLNSNFETSYDADFGLLTAKLRTDEQPLKSFNSITRGYIVWSASSKYGSGYEAENALGATIHVHEGTIVRYGLSFIVPNSYISNEFLARYTDYVVVSPQIAKKIKPNLRILVVAKLATPTTESDDRQSDPTFENPGDYHRIDRWLNVTLLRIILFDYQTGQILKVNSKPDLVTSPPTD